MSTLIRLLVSDIDGTLVRKDKSLADAVVAASRRLQDRGVAMSLISARPPSGMLWIAERLELNGPIGAFNGGTIVMSDGTPVSADRLDPAAAARALALLDRPGVTAWLFADGRWYAKAPTTHDDSERRAANIQPILDADFGALLARVDKLVGVSDDHDLLATMDGEMVRALGTAATVARSQPYYLDVTGPRGNKGDGVTALAHAYGVPLDAVAVLGDQRNDLPMFARAGLSVAMGQAPPEVRAEASHVARSNEEDGVADAIERFVLPSCAAAGADT